MASHLRAAFVVLVSLTLVTGIAYPFAVTAIAKLAFPAQAEGSFVEHGGRVRGSRLIGQPFDDPSYVWGRLSATAPYPYNAGSSAASNVGPSNPALEEAATKRLTALRAADPETAGRVPVDLVTASASGLDPHVSPEAAHFQAPRVARARGISVATVVALIAMHTEPPTLGILGEPRVNVLALNQALDDLR